jgi:hypothetical protein
MTNQQFFPMNSVGLLGEVAANFLFRRFSAVFSLVSIG